MAATTRVLVVDDGSALTALAACRGLTRAGFAVGLVSPASGITAASRAVSRLHPVPLGSDLDAVVQQVGDVSHEYDVVIATGDSELLELSARREQLQAPLLLPEHPSVLSAFDKLTLTDVARAVGLTVPGTWRADDPDLDRMPSDLPVVVKPRLHRSTGSERLSTRVCALGARHSSERSDDAIVQETVTGPLSAVVVALAPDGRLLAVSQQVAEVVYPSPVGNCVRGHTVPVDDELLARLLALCERIGWWGVAQFELLGDALVDLNGRPYGSLGLAQAAGADPVVAAVQAMVGQAPEQTLVGNAGVRWSSLGRDLRAAQSEPEHRLRATVAAVRAATSSAHASWQRDDPRPVLRQLRRLTTAARRRLSPG